MEREFLARDLWSCSAAWTFEEKFCTCDQRQQRDIMKWYKNNVFHKSN